MNSAGFYLASYNAAMACGWTLLLWRILSQEDRRDNLQLANFLELAAFMEVLHSLFGLVRSGTLTAFMQWAGRTHVILAVVSQVPQAQLSFWLWWLLLAWSISEVIRYPQYVLSIFGACPAWLTWLRYTGFIPLFPVGLAAEMALMKQSLSYIEKTNMYAGLFKLLPFSYHQFISGLLLVYPLLGGYLYRHMLLQRASKLGGHRKKLR